MRSDSADCGGARWHLGPPRGGAARSSSTRGLGVLLLAVMSPIDYWASRYFFVHMIEHILIAFFAPILIVARGTVDPALHGLPVGVRRRWGRALLLAGVDPTAGRRRFVTRPWTAFVAFNLVMVLWHVPVFFDAAENNQLIHIWLMHASFFVTGILFWLTIIPSHPFRITASPLWQMGAIIGTNVTMFIIAMTLSIFTATSWYSVYAHVQGVTLSPFGRPADRCRHPVDLW